MNQERNPKPPPESDGGGPDVKTDPIPDRGDPDSETAAGTEPTDEGDTT